MLEKTYLIDDWLVKPESLTVQHKSLSSPEIPELGRTRIQKKTMQVLLALIEADNNVISKETIMNKVWADSVVTENSLNQAISELRKCFNDSAKSAVIIENIPKQGYRIIPPIVEVSEQDFSAKDSKKNATASRLFNRTAIFSAITILAIGLFFLSWPPDNMPTLTEEQISPDGRYTAFFNIEDDKARLHIQPVDHYQAPIITEIQHPQNVLVAWSKDSKKVVYNATQINTTYFAFNVLDLSTGQTQYYKSAKKENAHQSESIPSDLNRPTESVQTEELHFDGQRVDRLKYSDSETISILFKDNQIVGFSWQ